MQNRLASPDNWPAQWFNDPGDPDHFHDAMMGLNEAALTKSRDAIILVLAPHRFLLRTGFNMDMTKDHVKFFAQARKIMGQYGITADEIG
ncbi:hypothetical protein FJZ28_03320 [Candidatus Peregrinibacteria bacterium]|nr:hypothetical protein [Candidatus Peregrinibacteria bacterium]